MENFPAIHGAVIPTLMLSGLVCRFLALAIIEQLIWQTGKQNILSWRFLMVTCSDRQNPKTRRNDGFL